MPLRSRDHYLGVGYFVHPVPLSAVALLIFNDRWLKTHHPSWLSGKLSDFAGLFFFPLFLCALYTLGRGPLNPHQVFWITPRRLLTAILLTDLVFVAIKTIPAGAALYVGLLGALGFPSRVTMDLTDLWALMSSAAVYLYARPFFTAQ